MKMNSTFFIILLTLHLCFFNEAFGQVTKLTVDEPPTINVIVDIYSIDERKSVENFTAMIKDSTPLVTKSTVISAGTTNFTEIKSKNVSATAFKFVANEDASKFDLHVELMDGNIEVGSLTNLNVNSEYVLSVKLNNEHRLVKVSSVGKNPENSKLTDDYADLFDKATSHGVLSSLSTNLSFDKLVNLINDNTSCYSGLYPKLEKSDEKFINAHFASPYSRAEISSGLYFVDDNRAVFLIIKVSKIEAKGEIVYGAQITRRPDDSSDVITFQNNENGFGANSKFIIPSFERLIVQGSSNCPI